ncbi:PD40 domain-containing protein [Novosphingobium endophyticum]|nr:PD40 domain-containing protein [Novosphingobium endophyticum]
MKMIHRALAAVGCLAVVPMLPAPSLAQTTEPELQLQDAIELTPFGGRAAFSSDGKKIVFVDRTYGDAYEIDVATRQVRNLTAHLPHQGIMRIQYLASGDFLVTAPRVRSGPNTRAHLEMWVLDKTLKHGLQPLGQQVFEGIAVSRQTNLIAWTVIDPELKPKESWQLAFVRPTKRYVAEVTYHNGVPALSGKREIMPALPKECGFIEPQDFRDNDTEVVYSCMEPMQSGAFTISVMGSRFAEDRNITYRRDVGAYNEVEGLAPAGDWATVECGKQDKPGLPPLDICRLQLTPNGKMTLLVRGTTSGATGDISNPIVSPDGKWLVFQRSDSASGEIGEGYGLYMLRLPG